MTKFENIGIEYQKDAVSKEEANKRFLLSCRICLQRGMRIDCHKCSVAAANAMVLAAFDAAAQPLAKPQKV